MYQYTEAFCHYSSNSPEAKKSSSLNFTYVFGIQNQENIEDKKLREKNVEIMEIISQIKMTLR